MADKTINQLTEDTAPTTDDYVPTWDVGSGTSKKVSLANINAADYASKSGFLFDFVESGCVWSGDAYASTLNASMTSGVVWIGGKRLTVAAVTARAFTASKDTYVDLTDNGDGTAAFTYTAVANNAASPALAASAIRIGIIVTGATNIAAAGSVNQGQETKVLPIASSIPYSVSESLGNLICPRDPQRRVLSYRQVAGASIQTTTTTPAYVDATGISAAVNILSAYSGRKIKIKVMFPNMFSSFAAGSSIGAAAREGSTTLQEVVLTTGQNYDVPLVPEALTTPTVGLHTYLGSCKQTAAGTLSFGQTAAQIMYILVELV